MATNAATGEGLAESIFMVYSYWKDTIKFLKDSGFGVILRSIGPLGILTASIHGWLKTPGRSSKTEEIYQQLVKENQAPSLEKVEKALLLDPKTSIDLISGNASVGEIPIGYFTPEFMKYLGDHPRQIKTIHKDPQEISSKIKLLLEFLRAVFLTLVLRGGAPKEIAEKVLAEALPLLD